uniref:mRNA export factor GLE1 n=1 Tax=Picocystis salinarum TaxID=88271 RepID=A0A7S3XDU2_9CHLO|mmetsp:Transcript_5510/g.34080  ORF Transcript_5510/g.34080 Transcript_5510/m.34080 type:complete len:564 (-) Transcript_5510:145-1836(-)
MGTQVRTPTPVKVYGLPTESNGSFKVSYVDDDSEFDSESDGESPVHRTTPSTSGRRLSALRRSDVAARHLEQRMQEEAKASTAQLLATLDAEWESAAVGTEEVRLGGSSRIVVDAATQEQLQALRKRREMRDRRLKGLETALESEHKQFDAALAQKIKRQEEEAEAASMAAARAAAEAQKREEETEAAKERARLEKLKEEENKKVEEESKQKAEAAAARARAEEKDKADAKRQADSEAQDRTAVQQTGLRWGPPAQEFDSACSSALTKIRQAAESILSAGDSSTKKTRRNIDRKLGTYIAQISATQEQVVRKAGEIISSLEALKREGQALYSFGILSLCKRFISQVAAQVPQLPSFAFPVAEVAAEVCSRCPDVLLPLLGTLHEACPLTVPKLPVYMKSVYKSEAEFYRASGYRFLDSADDGTGGRPEATDDYLRRLKGFVAFYGAFTQVTNPRSTHGLDFAWMWLSRALNYLPCNRVVASALHAFLSSAGYAMGIRFGRQFQKLMSLIQTDVLPKLQTCKEDGAEAARMRLEAYIVRQEWRNPPEGRSLPRTDASSLTIHGY